MKLSPPTFLILLLSLFTRSVIAQAETPEADTAFGDEVVSSDWIDHGVTIGTDFSRYLYGELGYYRSYVWEAGGFPVVSTTMNYAMEFSYFDNLVLAPKIQARLHVFLLDISLSALYYSDLNSHNAIKLRPEIGFALHNLDINYGYNFNIYNNGFDRANKHMIGIRYYLQLHRKQLNEYDRDGNSRPYR